jgi:hypothetical protein
LDLGYDKRDRTPTILAHTTFLDTINHFFYPFYFMTLLNVREELCDCYGNWVMDWVGVGYYSIRDPEGDIQVHIDAFFRNTIIVPLYYHS